MRRNAGAFGIYNSYFENNDSTDVVVLSVQWLDLRGNVAVGGTQFLFGGASNPMLDPATASRSSIPRAGCSPTPPSPWAAGRRAVRPCGPWCPKLPTAPSGAKLAPP